MDIGAKIKKYRLEKNMEQKELAKILNVSPKTISSWEVNRTQPKMEMIEAMCNVFGCKKSDFMDDDVIEIEYYPPRNSAGIGAFYSAIIEISNKCSADEIDVAIKLLETLRDSKRKKEE